MILLMVVDEGDDEDHNGVVVVDGRFTGDSEF